VGGGGEKLSSSSSYANELKPFPRVGSSSDIRRHWETCQIRSAPFNKTLWRNGVVSGKPEENRWLANRYDSQRLV